MPTTIQAYRVFIASPGGLHDERQAFREVINEYNESEAIHRKALFVPVGWEITLGGVGRPQSLINEEIRQCDFFVLVLWNRGGRCRIQLSIRKSIEYYERIHDSEGVARSYQRLAEVLKKMGRGEEAQELSDKAAELSDASSEKTDIE